MLQVTSDQWLQWLSLYFWPLLRVLALITTAPILSERAVPKRVKLGLGIIITLVIAPSLPPNDVPIFSFNALWLAMQQILIGIALGAEDYVRNLRTERSPEGTELLFARCSILQAARSAGIQAFDTVYSDANNEAGFLHEASHIKQLGFDGKSLINPRQIELLHNLYAPTRKELAHARQVVEAAEAAAREGRGVVSLNGKMVDSPVIERALLVISRAELSGIREE